MHPILTSILLGLTAAAANVFGGAIIVQKHWERRFLRYFVALGAGFMLATSLLEMVPESVRLNPVMAGMVFLLGDFLGEFFFDNNNPHFFFSEGEHPNQI